jgi:hypothetical protein
MGNECLMSAEQIDAIYELREAAAEHGRVEAETADRNDQPARAKRLAAREKLEEKTFQAIEACHECGDAHAGDRRHTTWGQVIEGDFGRLHR